MGIDFEIQHVSKNTVAVIDENLASNAGAILLDDCIVAVDVTMRPDTARTFRAMLEDNYHRPVKYVCVTHYHGDHVFGLTSVKDVTLFGAWPIAENIRRKMISDWTPQALAAWKKEDPTVAAWADEVELIIPPMLFHQRLDLINRDKIIEFYHVGGHTSCCVYGYYPDEKILFAGDLIFSGQMPFAGDATCDPEQWMASLKTWLTWDIARVIPGHGPVAGMDEIKKHLEFFELMKAATLDIVKAGKEPHDIEIPAVYEAGGMEAGLLERTKERWHEYYSLWARSNWRSTNDNAKAAS
jgi:cyclase